MGCSSSVDFATLNSQNENGNTNLMRHLMSADEYDGSHVLNIIRQHGESDIAVPPINYDLQNNKGETLLMLACRRHRDKLVTHILTQDIDVNICDVMGFSAIYFSRTLTLTKAIMKHKSFADKSMDYTRLANYLMNTNCYNIAQYIVENKNITFAGDKVESIFISICTRGSGQLFAIYIYKKYYVPHTLSAARYLTLLTHAGKYHNDLVNVIFDDIATKLTPTDTMSIRMQHENQILKQEIKKLHSSVNSLQSAVSNIPTHYS
ncbi:MAG: hypothetical protein Faunusvirus4_10 [Faunusvirus sp.]|uniref:Uncharacterized protein n=1 Tax=Faunusvirus sp. TaxID=2487766 RepID=A0A3G5A104_9VIRU|nr:MAG: hypothetical protein Faunusvirus4_10 [Faunusvirus sp.]